MAEGSGGFFPVAGAYDQAGGRLGLPRSVTAPLATPAGGVDEWSPNFTGTGTVPGGGTPPQGVLDGVRRGEIDPDAAQILLDLYYQLIGSVSQDAILGFDPQAEAQRFIELARRGDMASAVTGLQGVLNQVQDAADRAGTERDRQRQAQEVAENQRIDRERLGLQGEELGVSRGYLANAQAQQRLSEQQAVTTIQNETQRRREFMTGELAGLAGQKSDATQGMMDWLTSNVANLPPPGGTSDAARLYASLATGVGAQAAPPVSFDGPLTIPPFLLPFQGLEEEIRALAPPVR